MVMNVRRDAHSPVSTRGNEMSANDFVQSWENAVNKLTESTEAVSSNETTEETARETENLFEAARW